MSRAATSPRGPLEIQEELGDLRRLLAGLPDDWRESGAFLSYEERLRQLDEELALARVAELLGSLAVRTGEPDPMEPGAAGADPASLAECLARRTARLDGRLRAVEAASRTLNRIVLITVIGVPTAVVLTFTGLLGGWFEYAVGSFCLLYGWFVGRWSKLALDAARAAPVRSILAALRAEVLQLQVPTAARMLRTDAAGPTTARVEALIDSLHAALPVSPRSR